MTYTWHTQQQISGSATGGEHLNDQHDEKNSRCGFVRYGI